MSTVDLDPEISGPPPIDPFAAAPGGQYEDDLVSVRARSVAGASTLPHEVRTPHFVLSSADGRVVVEHDYSLDRLDDDLAGAVADELFQQGWVRGSDLFERIFTGIVLSCAADPLVAWDAFYANTLRRVAEHAKGPGAAAHGSIADYAPVYERAAGLVQGSVLELGACFGFFSLVLAERGHAVLANDVNEGTVRLLATIAARRGLTLRTVAADAARVPLPDRSVDTVVALHLLEHLSPEHGAEVLAEAVRCARQRVVVAVPYEDVPDPAFGHVRTVTAADLVALGRRTGHPFEQLDEHGGWLVIDVGGDPTA